MLRAAGAGVGGRGELKQGSDGDRRDAVPSQVAPYFQSIVLFACVFFFFVLGPYKYIIYIYIISLALSFSPLSVFRSLPFSVCVYSVYSALSTSSMFSMARLCNAFHRRSLAVA